MDRVVSKGREMFALPKAQKAKFKVSIRVLDACCFRHLLPAAVGLVILRLGCFSEFGEPLRVAASFFVAPTCCVEGSLWIRFLTRGSSGHVSWPHTAAR